MHMLLVMILKLSLCQCIKAHNKKNALGNSKIGAPFFVVEKAATNFAVPVILVVIRSINIIKLIVSVLFLIPSVAIAQNTEVEGDFDCDGKADTAIIQIINKKVILSVQLGNEKPANILKFGLDNPSSQVSLCGTTAHLSTNAPSDNEYFEAALGETPEGYNTSSQCLDLNISGGECDSMHIFWNHNTNKFNWWRL